MLLQIVVSFITQHKVVKSLEVCRMGNSLLKATIRVNVKALNLNFDIVVQDTEEYTNGWAKLP